MAKKLTLKELTENEQQEVKLRLNQARKNMGRTLTNAEEHKIKEQTLEMIQITRERAAKIARAKKRAAQVLTQNESFNWSASVGLRPPRG